MNIQFGKIVFFNDKYAKSTIPVDYFPKILLVLEFNGSFSYEVARFLIRPILDPKFTLVLPLLDFQAAS